MIHAGEVQVEFINGRLFIHGSAFHNNFGHQVGVFAVQAAVAPYYNGLRAKLHGHTHGHGGLYAKAPGLITAGGHHSPGGGTADQHRFSVKFRIEQSFAGNEKRVQVDMKNGALHTN